jgi:hypothetical protein
MYMFKNRSQYAQKRATEASNAPTSWEQTVVNREIEWKLGMDGLSYRVTGTRVNRGESIVRQQYAKVTLYEGLKKGVHSPDRDILQAIADAWAATILLGDGEAYNGHNAQGEGPLSPLNMTCSEGPYPYIW